MEVLRMLVLGATGRIGRPIVHLLLARGHRVRAGVRDPASAAAADLARLGAEVVLADFDGPETIVAAARGAGAVVATGTAHRAGPDGERRHGLALADALGEAQAGHVVYVSGAGADRPTGVPVFESKRAVEQRIAEVGLAATILAPVYLMENAFNPWNLPALASGRFPLPLPADRTLAQVAIDDVAEAAVHVVERPEEFAGRRIELASDALTGAQAAERLSRVTGRAYAFERLPLDTLAPPLRLLFEWLDSVGFDGVEASGRSFERWAAEQRWPG
jgi:uncharacterized protein YbjT (DUF2867 family)